VKHFLMNMLCEPQYGFYVEYRKKLYLLGYQDREHESENDPILNPTRAINRKTFLLLRAEAKKDLRQLQRAKAKKAFRGKSRTVRALAKKLGISVINLDMSKIKDMLNLDETNLRTVLAIAGSSQDIGQLEGNHEASERACKMLIDYLQKLPSNTAFTFGPGGPGTGKSMIASGIATVIPPMPMEMGEIDMSKIPGEYVGSERSMKQALESMPEQTKPVIFKEDETVNKPTEEGEFLYNPAWDSVKALI